tara:strand:+ start:180 stop:398 length:219 start_codon:yes stop_codon:yes gene_type:complete
MKENTDLSDKAQEDIIANAAAREIVHEIMNFGVSQQQIKQIINLLALELEDNNLMRSIVGLIKSNKTEKLHV